MRPVINTSKRYNQYTITTIALGSIGQEFVVKSVAAPNAAVTSEVREGSKVSAVYIEMWIGSDDATVSSFNFSVEKIPGNGAFMTTAQASLLNTYPNKKNILYTAQGLIPPTNQSAIPVIRQWIKIPKSKQRMGLDDRIVLNMKAISNGINYCGFSLFKEQY